MVSRNFKDLENIDLNAKVVKNDDEISVGLIK